MLAQYSDTWWLPCGQLAACTLVKVYPVDSNIPAPLYADACGRQKLPNPLRTNDRGQLVFWAEEGKYWLHIDGRTHPITVGEESCVTEQDLDTALAGHVQSGDPHGDRAAAQASLMHHQATTKAVHGIADTANLATKADVENAGSDAIGQACSMVDDKIRQHEMQTRNVHGICDTGALVTHDQAQAMANQAVDAARLLVTEHAGKTKGVHGIPDTTVLVTQDQAKCMEGQAVDAARQLVDEHAGKTKGVHGIADTGQLVTRDELAKALEDAGGGGAPDLSEYATKEGAQEKADAAQKAAEAAAAQCCEATARKAEQDLQRALEGLQIPDLSQLATKDGAQEKADAAQKAAEAAAAQCCEATAKKAADDLAAAVKKLEDEGGGGGGGDVPDLSKYATKDEAQAKADAAEKAAIEAAAKDAAAKADAAEKGAKQAAAECCEATAKKAADDLAAAIKKLEDGGSGDGGGGGGDVPDLSKYATKEGAQAKADAAEKAAKAAAAECCEATAKKAADDLAAAVKKIEDGGGGGDAPDLSKYETKEGAQKKADEAAAKAVAEHVKKCHALKIITEGVTALKGWEANITELRVKDGVHSAFIRLKRTGGSLYSKGPDFQSDGEPSQGNIVPDMKIATIEGEWLPPQSYEVGAHTSYTSGSVRVQPNGDIYLLDLTYNNPIRKGHLLRIEYEFITKSPCEETAAGDGGSDGKSTDGGKDQPVPPSAGGSMDGAQLAKLLADSYPSGYATSARPRSVRGEVWDAAPEEPVRLTMPVPPSLKVKVTTAMRAANGVSGLAQAHQAVEITKGKKVIVPAGAFPTATVSQVKLNEVDASTRAYIVDFSQAGGGEVKAGDEVTFTVHNRTTLGEVEVLDRDVCVESLVG